MAEFDGVIDATDRLIGLLAVAARDGGTEAIAEIADLHGLALGLLETSPIEALAAGLATVGGPK